jgi:MoaA/NifB/PqqE/SkfB family radical SAM enzyme
LLEAAFEGIPGRGASMPGVDSVESDADPPERRFALGIGLTNECNLACAFCYRDPSRVDRLDLEQVRAVLDRLPVQSVNLGTGENGMHPRFHELLAFLRSRTVKLTMTSNGLSVAVLEDQELRAFHDIEFSLDYPNREEQDGQRGPGNWDLVHEQAERCRRLGVPVTFIAVMMRTNFRRLAEIATIAAKYGAPLRVNVYQSVRTDTFALTYQEYWEAFELLLSRTDVLTVGEPLVRAMLGLPDGGGGCGRGTVRVTPRATVQPCVYWPGAGDPLSSLLDAGAHVVDTPAVSGRALGARRLRALRAARSMSGGMCRSSTPRWRARSSRSVLPHRPR